MENGERITELLEAWRGGNETAEGELLDLIYPHLRAIAANRLRGERASRSLETTELVQEAFVKLLGQRKAQWKNRAHFYAIAARLMRRILVDSHRKQQRIRHGGEVVRVALGSLAEVPANVVPDWLALHQALERLGAIDSTAEQVVELRFFAGLTHEEAATVLGCGVATVERRWRFARAWLAQHLTATAG